MKIFRYLPILFLATILVISACGKATPGTPGEQPPASALPTDAPVADGNPPASTGPDTVDTTNWSTTASTRTLLSFAFPGNWDGSSPLTFGEGEFVKDPDKSLGVTFQIELTGDPAALLSNWGSKDIGIVGIVTFTPETITDGDNVVIARLNVPTRVAEGNGITAQVAYVQRPDDVMEVTWFAPTDEWESLQPTFQAILNQVEIWRKYADSAIGLQTMYVHDWLDPQNTWQDTGLWFRSADEQTGVAIFVMDEITDPAQVLAAWSAERLQPVGLTGCTLADGNRMSTLSGEWASKTGECDNANGEKVTYETAFVADKDRLLEIITYAPSATWDVAGKVAFKHLLGMLIDIR